jgi:hypothetical protein
MSIATSPVNYWRVMCQTNHHPGQWQSWYRNQCCAVGWHPSGWKDVRGDGWSFDPGVRSDSKAWSAARNAMHGMRARDMVVAMLPGGRVGRIGEIIRVEADDEQWDPIVPPSSKIPFGENGRRIQVRWELGIGPSDPGTVVQLPDGMRNYGQETITRLNPERFQMIREVMQNEASWMPFHGTFAFEEALSDYIAVHPYRLEDGLILHPYVPSIREWAIAPGNRIDVVLYDKVGRTVLVECKQTGLQQIHIEQLARYLGQARGLYPEWGEPRGILVHGGSRHVSQEFRVLASSLDILLVRHELRVDFSGT